MFVSRFVLFKDQNQNADANFKTEIKSSFPFIFDHICPVCSTINEAQFKVKASVVDVIVVVDSNLFWNGIVNRERAGTRETKKILTEWVREKEKE